MITVDPQRRASRLAELQELLQREAPPEDRDLILQLAPAFFAEMPDRISLGLPKGALAARMRGHFRFIAREIPSAHQLYKGLPGIHVSARNPGEDEARAIGGGQGLPVETTIIETHTIDAPFIFESLKNYFRKQELRVFSAIHPIFSVRRQWERIVAVGGPRDEGAKECYCHFQVEELDSKERLRRVEHEIYSVLKSVFTAVEDFQDMLRTVRELEPRLRAREGDGGGAASAKAFLDWLLADNYIFQGTVKYQIGPDGRPDRIQESATGVFTDPALLPVVFPGLMEEVEAHIAPAPGDREIIDIDYCNNASAIYHLDPIDDIVVREWAKDGSLASATVLLGRLAKGAVTQRAADIPLLKEKQEWILAQSGAMPQSHAYREIRALFNRFPQRELFYATASSLKELIERVVYMTSDEETAIHLRPGIGYVALSVAFSRLRYSYRVEEDLRAAFTQAFGPISFSTSADCGTVSLLLFYFEAKHLERPVDVGQVRALVAPLITTWEDRASAALEQRFGEGEGRRLFRKYIRSESRSGLYRESTPPEQVPYDIRFFEALEGRLEVRVQPKTAELSGLNLYSVRQLGLTDTLRTLQNLGLTVVEELRLPLVLPEGRKAHLYRFELEAPPERIASLVSGEERFAKALRAIDEGRATDDPLNALVLMAELSWREVEVLRTLRNHLLQVRTHYNAETVNGVLLRNSGAAGALHREFRARFDPGLAGDRAAAVSEAEAGVAKALESVRSLAEDEVLRGLHNLIRASLRTNVFQRPERPVFSIKVDSRKVEGMPSPRPMFEIYVHSRLLEGIHLRVQGRQSHLPFGEELNATGTTDKHRFTSYERDSETGTDYAVNRQYAQGVGRFMRVDPYGDSYDLNTPQSMNRYSYTHGDPINAVDPLGLLRMVCTTRINGSAVQIENRVYWHATIDTTCMVTDDIRPEPPGHGGGGQRRRRYAPFPTNLRAALQALLNKNDGKCDNFVQNLLHQVASDTGRAAYSDNVLELYDTIDSMGGYAFEPPNVPGYANAGGTVNGSIERGNAQVIVAPIPEDESTTEHGKLMNQYFYAYTALHETLHLAAGHGRYSDRQLAQAAFNLGGLSQANIDYFNSLDKNNTASMSNFLDVVMQEHCKRP